MELEQYVAALADPNQPLARAGLKALADLDPRQTAEIWPTWQQIPEDRRLEVVQALVELGEDNIDLDFREFLFANLSDTDAEVRTLAVEGLWEDERSKVQARLIELLNDKETDVRAAAAVSLSRFAHKAELGELPAAQAQTLRTALLQAMADPDQPGAVRRRLVEALGYFADSTEAQAEIGRAYAQPDQLMRESAVMAMGRSMRPTWFPYIQRELRSPSPAMRYEAARAVGELGEDGQELVNALLPLVDDDDDEVSLASIWSLGQVGGQHAKRVLQRLVRSKDDARRQAAEEA
ncbi:MAG: HEAT repeat domain-containing protein, partial [Chloroflexaceae bacterium]|nr:HEAT repeat domain-containing protein [Chloroflexaceae bacterium]